MSIKHIAPIHPGVYIQELLTELGISKLKLSKDLHVVSQRIDFVLKGQLPITAELALRLGRYFGLSPQYWINLQCQYDMDIVEDEMMEEILREVKPLKVAV